MSARLCVLLAALCATSAWAEPTSLTVAVLDIRARGVEARVAEALLDVVTEEVGRAGEHKVISRKEIEALLGQEAKKQMLGCDETSCLAEIAGALNAELLVAGEVSRLDESVLFTLQLINNRYATVMNRVSINWPGSADRLPDVAQAASQLLVMEKDARKPGRIEVKSAPDGAELFLDEKPMKAPNQDGVDVGMHLIRISASGYEERVVPVIVKSGKTAGVNGTLQKIPLYKRPWFWSVGVVGAGAVGALGMGLLAGIPFTLILFNYGGSQVTAGARSPNAERLP